MGVYYYLSKPWFYVLLVLIIIFLVLLVYAIRLISSSPKDADEYISFLEDIYNKPSSIKQLRDGYPTIFSGVWLERETNQILVPFSDGKYHLSFQARMYLLQHQELNESRKSSRQSMGIAIIAILLAAVGLLWQIALQLLGK